MVDSTPTGQGPASITMSMRPRRSASTCAALVGETWPERLADGATTGPPKAASNARATGCAGTPHRDAVEPRERQIGDAAVRPLWQHQRQRPGPERGGQLARRRHRNTRGGARLDAADMGDQRIEAGPALGGVEPGDGLAVAQRRRRARRRSRSGTRPARRRQGSARLPRSTSVIGLHHPRSRLGGHYCSHACALEGPWL